jgi:hypothetical protein
VNNSLKTRQRKSPIALLFGVPAIAGIWYLIAQGFLKYQAALRPADAFLFSGTRVGNILLFVPPIFPSLGLGLMVGNVLEKLILTASAECALERQAVYRSAQIGLAKFSLILAAVALPLGFAGTNNYWALAPSRIDYRGMFSVSTSHYRWLDVTRIETGCSVGKTLSYHFVLTLHEGPSIDLMEESPSAFVAAYPEIQSSLRGQRYAFSNAGLSPCGNSLSRRWFEILFRPPTDPS